ncbi:hypothetical protein NDU88_000268 [Pleurodeles waltl]|uniref:Methyltransferase-like protein 4 n=1 Tax=Pleurodeles waltl TaxID=8319 RepID=A0AAV7URQ0_PLEWA|nr:hypothetical protein NDU88_000268 [Pleurodeles waltl]
MSVLLKSSTGWLVDHLQFLNNEYSHDPGLCFRDEYFQLLKPHIPGPISADATDTALLSSNCIERPQTRKRKRKRRGCALNQGELDALEYHLKISALISEGSKTLIEEGHKKGFLDPLPGSEKQQPRDPVGQGGSCRLTELCEMAKLLTSENENHGRLIPVLNEEPLSKSELDLLLHMMENSADCTRIIQLMGEKYLLPPKCSFLLSDISCMQPLLDYGKKYDVIVVDPPWENKSVKRSNRYDYLPSWHIRQLPVPALAAPGCLVITWVTNRQKHLRFVKDELYPEWSVKPLAEWHWVKITRSGEFVFPLESTHKKPYEVLVLGRLRAAAKSAPRQSDEDHTPIPDHKLIVSIPCTLHSHKPPLAEVLTDYIKPGAECLELFARNLQAGWTSWGNEVLKFQHIDYFCPLEDGS